MNPAKQKVHARVADKVRHLEEEAGQALEAIAESLHKLEGVIGAERTARNKMAGEQRTYVETELFRLKRDFDAHFDMLTLRVRSMTFWERLRWLITGKL